MVLPKSGPEYEGLYPIGISESTHRRVLPLMIHFSDPRIDVCLAGVDTLTSVPEESRTQSENDHYPPDRLRDISDLGNDREMK